MTIWPCPPIRSGRSKSPDNRVKSQQITDADHLKGLIGIPKSETEWDGALERQPSNVAPCRADYGNDATFTPAKSCVAAVTRAKNGLG